MEIFINIIFIFFIGGVFGYLLELTYRGITSRHFINPGFLHGPFLPIYGFGLLFLFGLSSIRFPNINLKWVEILIKVILIFVSLNLIEYIGGLIFIKGFGLKLWDYSDQKWNIQGIICPLFSLIWGLIGTFYFFFLHPLILYLLNLIDGKLLITFILGIFIGIFIVDLILSFNIASKIVKIVKDINLHVTYDKLKIIIKKYAIKHKLKHRFFHPFKGSEGHIKSILNDNRD